MAGTKTIEQRLDDWWEKHYADVYGEQEPEEQPVVAEQAVEEVVEEPPSFVRFGEGSATLAQLAPSFDDPDVVRRSDNAFQGASLTMSIYGEELNKYGSEYDVDPHLLASIAGYESGGNSTAVGPTNDLGLMQFTPRTWNEIMPGRSLDDRLDPELSIEAAAKLIAREREALANEDLAVLAYNVGVPRVQQIVRGESEFPGISRFYWPVVTLTHERLRQSLIEGE